MFDARHRHKFTAVIFHLYVSMSCYQILRVDEGVVGSSLTPPAGSWTWNEPP